MIKLEGLTLDEVNLIISGLLELPAKFSLDLIGKIREQTIPQVENGGDISENHSL